MKTEEKAFLEETIKEVEHKLENKEALSMFKKQLIVWLGHDAPGCDIPSHCWPWSWPEFAHICKRVAGEVG